MVKVSEYFFYVLKCSDNFYYGGYIIDVICWEVEYNVGIRCKYIKICCLVKVIYFEKFEIRSEVIKVEVVFKKLLCKNKDVYLI